MGLFLVFSKVQGVQMSKQWGHGYWRGFKAAGNFPIEIQSRCDVPNEIAELKACRQDLYRRGLSRFIKFIFYDSKACLCSVKFREPLPQNFMYSDEWAEIRDCLYCNVSQYEYDGTIGHMKGTCEPLSKWEAQKYYFRKWIKDHLMFFKKKEILEFEDSPF
jgi:hypothetical protein